jgi:hypothetical protein
MARRTTLTLFVLGALLLTGCQQTIVNEKITLNPGDIKDRIIEAPSREQKVVVEVSSGAPVNVWIVLESERQAVKAKLGIDQVPDPARVVASKQRIPSGTVEGTVPAGKEYAVILSGATQKTEVQLKVTGR